MANNTIFNFSEEDRCKFAVSLINKLSRTGDLVAGDVTPLTDMASFITMLENKRKAVANNLEQQWKWQALEREVSWLGVKGILTTTVIGLLATIRGTSATTDLRFCFSQCVQSDPNFDATREDFHEAASGSINY